MIFHQLEIPGAYLLEPEHAADRRGFFARNYCRRELETRGLDPTIVQCEVSVNRRGGTVQGMHYQAAPYAEVKLLRGTAGAVFGVIVDLRRESSTFKQHFGIELSRDNRLSLYVPAGVGHGFQTLADDSEVFLQMSEFIDAGCGRGVRWNDPAFSIEWPREVTKISQRDREFPDFEG